MVVIPGFVLGEDKTPKKHPPIPHFVGDPPKNDLTNQQPFFGVEVNLTTQHHHHCPKFEAVEAKNGNSISE